LKTGFLDESSADDHVSKNLFPAIELHPRILANTRFRISTFELRERARRSKSGDILEGSAFGRLGFQLCFDKPQDLPAVKACTLVLPDLDYLKAQWKSLREDYPELQLPPLTIAPSKGIASNLDFIQTLIANDALVSDAAEFVHDMQIHVLAVISQRFGDKIDTQIAFINLYRELRQTWNELWPRYPLAFAGLPELPVTASNSRIALEKILAALIRAPLGVLAKQDAEPLHQLKQLCIKAVKTREMRSDFFPRQAFHAHYRKAYALWLHFGKCSQEWRDHAPALKESPENASIKTGEVLSFLRTLSEEARQDLGTSELKRFKSHLEHVDRLQDALPAGPVFTQEVQRLWGKYQKLEALLEDKAYATLPFLKALNAEKELLESTMGAYTDVLSIALRSEITPFDSADISKFTLEPEWRDYFWGRTEKKEEEKRNIAQRVSALAVAWSDFELLIDRQQEDPRIAQCFEYELKRWVELAPKGELRQEAAARIHTAIIELKNPDIKESNVSLDLSKLELSSLPKGFQLLRNLTHLDLSTNKFSSLPEEILEMHRLKSLELSKNQIESLPAALFLLPGLETLDASENCLDIIEAPDTLVKVMKRLKLSNNKIRVAFLGRGFQIESLDLSYNQLSSLEYLHTRVTQSLNLAHNKLQWIQPSFRSVPKLLFHPQHSRR
jgi:hypothetical protein